MSLVDYGSSGDESDVEEVKGTSGILVAHAGIEESSRKSICEQNEVNFSFLPVPKPREIIATSSGINVVRGGRKGTKIQILIPSLSELKDEEPDEEMESVPAKKKIKPSEMKSALIDMLPPPVHSREQEDFVPRQITKKVNGVLKSDQQPKVQHSPHLSVLSSDIDSATVDTDDEMENSGSVDFFSLSSAHAEEIYQPSVSAHVNEKNNLSSSACVFPAGYSYEHLDSEQLHSPAPFTDDAVSSSVQSTEDAVSSSTQLTEDAMMKLCSRRDRNQMAQGVQVLDLNEDTILTESKKLLSKQLTEEVTYRSSNKKKDAGGPSSLQKRKHQITYLAYQAKERELELKNQWANNRLTKKQIQSKYGF